MVSPWGLSMALALPQQYNVLCWIMMVINHIILSVILIHVECQFAWSYTSEHHQTDAETQLQRSSFLKILAQILE